MRDKHRELRASLDSGVYVFPTETIRALLAEMDAMADALLAIEGLHEHDMPLGEAAMALYEASNIAHAALAQGEV